MADPKPEPPRKPDAIKVPKSYRPASILQAGGPDSELAAIGREFVDVLNPETSPELRADPPRARRVTTRNCGPHRFVSLDVMATPEDSLRRPYYRWEPQPNGVLYGYLLVSDAAPAPGEATFASGPEKG